MGCDWCSVSLWLCYLCTINFEHDHLSHWRSKDLCGASDRRDKYFQANYWLVATLPVTKCCSCWTVMISKALLSVSINDVVISFYESVSRFFVPLVKHFFLSCLLSLNLSCHNFQINLLHPFQSIPNYLKFIRNLLLLDSTLIKTVT